MQRIPRFFPPLYQSSYACSDGVGDGDGQRFSLCSPVRNMAMASISTSNSGRHNLASMPVDVIEALFFVERCAFFVKGL